MRDIAHQAIPEDTLKLLWVGRLPLNIRQILQVSEGSTAEELAKLADRVSECLKPHEVNVVNNPSTSAADDRFDELQKQISEIRQLLKNQTFGNRNRSRSHNRYYRYRSKSNSKEASNNDICYYHRRFGSSAKKCAQPCTFKKSSN